MSNIDLGIVGLGWWGLKLLRSFRCHPSVGRILGYDSSEAAIRNAIQAFSDFKPAASFEELLRSNISGLIIATPPATHYALCRAAINAGVNVLVTKPPVSTKREMEELVYLAREKDLVFMVDATYLFNPALERVISEVSDLGSPRSIRILRFGDNMRVNHLSRIRNTMFANVVDVVRDLLFHDIAVLSHLFANELRFESAIRIRNLDDQYADSAVLFLKAGKTDVILEYSWVYPERRREYQFFYRDRFVVFDDLSPQEKAWSFTFEDKLKTPLTYIWKEPLGNVADHFIDCLMNGREPKTGPGFMLDLMSVMDVVNHIQEESI
jgi:predicted dehydrogenase